MLYFSLWSTVRGAYVREFCRHFAVARQPEETPKIQCSRPTKDISILPKILNIPLTHIPRLWLWLIHLETLPNCASQVQVALTTCLSAYSKTLKTISFCFQVKVWRRAHILGLAQGAGRIEATPSDLVALSLAACQKKLKMPCCLTVGYIWYI